MPTYQVVPYLLQVHLRGKPDETKPVDSFNAGGDHLKDVIVGILHAAMKEEFSLDQDDSRRVRIDDVALSVGKGVSATVGIGTRGVRSSISGRSGPNADPEEFQRHQYHWEWHGLKARFFFPAGVQHGYIFLEKLSTSSPISGLSRLLIPTFQDTYPELMLKIKPAMTAAAVHAMVKGQPAKALHFKAPMAKDPSGKTMSLGGQEFGIDIKVTPGRGKSFSLEKLVGAKVPDAANLLGVLEATVGAPGLTQDGWRPSVEYRTAGGATRRVDYLQTGDDDHAVTLSFELSEGGEGADGDEQLFVESITEACRELGALGLDRATEDDFRKQPSAWSPGKDDVNWKVVCDADSRFPRSAT